MHMDTRFGERVAAARARLERLRAGTALDAEIAFEELQTAHEELSVLQEELSVQNEELAVAAARIEEERDRYWELFQLAPDAYLVTTPEGAIVEANHAATALLNLPARRLSGKPLGVFVSPEARRTFRTRLAQVAHLDRLDDWELEIHPRRRAAVPVACTVTVVRGADRQPTALRWILRDVSERHRAEDAAHALVRGEAARAAAEGGRARLDAVLRQLPAGVLMVDAAGRVSLLNDEAERILGADGVSALTSTEGQAGGAHLLDRSLAGETIREAEISLRRGDGGGAVLRCNAAPVRGAGGEVAGAVVSFTDVTEELRRERGERLLAQVGEVLSSSLDYGEVVQQLARVCAGTLADYCVVHAREGDSVRALGIAHADPTRAELVRGLLRRFPVAGDDPHHPILQALRTGRAECFAPVRDEDLDRLCVGSEHLEMLQALGLSSAMVVPVRARGETMGVLTLARTGGGPYDAADLALAEEVGRRAALAVENARLYTAARAAVRARDDVVAVVSHDLRNPINAVLVAATVLAELGDADALPERDRRQLGVIRRAAEQMSALVQDLVEVSSLESGTMTMTPRPMEPAVLLNAACDMFVRLAEERAVALACLPLDEGLPVVSADYGRMLQVLGNLVGNAVKFTPAGGEVMLGAVRVAGYVRFWVRDTGPGIERDHLPRLFDRFWQARRGAGAGAGLGLAIAHSIVQAHGGQIWAESTLGEGSTFHFTLPVVS